MKHVRLLLMIGIVAGFAIGCASAPTAPTAGQRTVIKESGKTPDWVTHVPAEENGMLYFRGYRTRALAYEDGLTDARMDAMRNIAERVQTVVHTSYEKARVEYGIPKDDQDAGRDLEDGIIAQAKAAVTGAKEKDAWWQEYTETSPGRVSYFYDVAILMELSKADFERSLANTLEGAEQKAKDAKNQKAAEVLERMRQDIKANP
jgi:hypothetical protein